MRLICKKPFLSDAGHSVSKFYYMDRNHNNNACAKGACSTGFDFNTFNAATSSNVVSDLNQASGKSNWILKDVSEDGNVIQIPWVVDK